MAKTKHPPAPAEGDLTALLQRVDRWLSKHRPHFFKSLAPGATPEELASLQGALGRPLPDELRTWFTWHNGQGEEMAGAFVESWNVLSVAEALDAKKGLDDEPPPGWKTTWLPLLDDGTGDYVCVCLEKSPAPVREVWQGRKRHSIIAPSLTDWARDFVTALEVGAFVEDPERGGFHRQQGAG
jgi:cell wall assembly regulator SMI1